MERYLTQAADYEGKPVGWCRHYDQYGEEHVILKMQHDKETYWLDWIGGEYAEEPDEFMCDPPFKNLKWRDF
jgi:hypothetical protein